jgi:hypothetical protein
MDSSEELENRRVEPTIMATKQEVIRILEVIRSVIGELDPRGTEDTVTMALMIGALAIDHVSAGQRVPGPEKLRGLAFRRFFEEMGREPHLGSRPRPGKGPREWSPRDQG